MISVQIRKKAGVPQSRILARKEEILAYILFAVQKDSQRVFYQKKVKNVKYTVHIKQKNAQKNADCRKRKPRKHSFLRSF